MRTVGDLIDYTRNGPIPCAVQVHRHDAVRLATARAGTEGDLVVGGESATVPDTKDTAQVLEFARAPFDRRYRRVGGGRSGFQFTGSTPYSKDPLVPLRDHGQTVPQGRQLHISAVPFTLPTLVPDEGALRHRQFRKGTALVP